MNILMIHPHDLFDKSEPWTTRISNIARKLTERNHKVKLCYFPLTLKYENIPESVNSLELIPLDRTPSPSVFIKNTKKLIELSRWTDVVHFQKCHHYAAIPAVIAAYITQKPLHYDWDDWEEKIWYESCGKGLHARFIGVSFKILERWLPVLADSVSCASSYLQELTHKFGVKKEFIFNTPVGADLEKFKPGLDGSEVKKKYNIKEDLVLYVGQLHGAQYADLFIKAANIVLHKQYNVSFMIVGEGFLEHKLKKLVFDLGLKEKIIFTGAIEHKDIPRYIAAADICVAPFKETEVSRCKSPLKVVEYLASGKPIVVSLVGEVRNMAGGCAVLTEEGNFHSLAGGILRLLGDRILRKRLAKGARARVEDKYNWYYTADSLLCAYEKILK
ncbi:MAG: glycosyltransferase family 4 protein [Candidatus Omnitrophota bacterium]